MCTSDFEFFTALSLRILNAHILHASRKTLINWANQFRKPLQNTSRIKHLQNTTLDNENTFRMLPFAGAFFWQIFPQQPTKGENTDEY
jgi:hypothetical protein